MRIFALRDQIDRLVIEACGVAEPQRLTSLARAEPDLDCQRVVTTVCAQSFSDRLADPATCRIVESQVAGADAIVFSRQDTADPRRAEQSRSVVTAINPRARVWPEIAVQMLVGPHRHAAMPTPRASHFERFGAVVIDLPPGIDRTAFEAFFAAAPPSLHRAKGFVTFGGDDRTQLFQLASGDLWIEPHGRSERGVAVLLGPGLDAEGLRLSFLAALMAPDTTPF
ncbi:MAG: GTP-binding protein [Paracoccus sp. (in: a-proteobacteria)]|nr:GTP-binding protein [Paracoccus sp. (in: a-proteobacteria)]